MIDDLDEAEKNVRKLQKNVRVIIKNTLAENAPEQIDSDETEGNEAPEATNETEDANAAEANDQDTESNPKSDGNEITD